MHPVDPWLVLFAVLMTFAMGGAFGFSIGVSYVIRKRDWPTKGNGQ